MREGYAFAAFSFKFFFNIYNINPLYVVVNHASIYN